MPARDPAGPGPGPLAPVAAVPAGRHLRFPAWAIPKAPTAVFLHPAALALKHIVYRGTAHAADSRPQPGTRTPRPPGDPVPGCTSSPGAGPAPGTPGRPASCSRSRVPPRCPEGPTVPVASCSAMAATRASGLSALIVAMGVPGGAGTPRNVIRPAPDG